MKSHLSRSALVLVSTTLLSTLGGASAFASTASGTSGVGGGAFVGETVVASAWERSVGAFDVELNSVTWNPTSTDVYNYRMELADGAPVDVQPTDGLERLSETEQDQWYVDSGLAPYQFTWLVFYCPETAPISVPDQSLYGIDSGINLDNVVSRSIAGADGFPSFTNSEFDSYTTSFYSLSILEPEVTNSDFNSSFFSYVQSGLRASDNSDSGFIPIEVSYLDFSCPATGAPPMVGRIVNSDDYLDQAVNRSLTIGPTIKFIPYSFLVGQPTVLEIPSAGTYIGVTGDFYLANAALWGVTHVNDGARALPNTGVDANATWTATAGAVTLALAGALLVGIRRKTAR